MQAYFVLIILFVGGYEHATEDFDACHQLYLCSDRASESRCMF